MPRERQIKSSRIIFCLITIIVLFAVCGLRLSLLMLPADAAVAAKENNSISVNLYTARGTIYDRRFLPLTDSCEQYITAAVPTEKAVISLSEQLSGAAQRNALSRLEEGRPAVVYTDKSISGGGVVSLKSTKRYSGLASHIIGYLGGNGRGVSGVEKDFDEILYSGLAAKAYFTVSADGTVLPGVEPEISLPETLDNCLQLTIDREIQKVCETAMSGISSGAAIVTEISGGEIVAMVSRPDFDPENVAASLNDSSGPLLNRALAAYNVGSIFKPLAAAAALEQGYDESLTVSCAGSAEVDGRAFACHKELGHGEMSLADAISQSCNVFFYDLSSKIDMSRVLSLCRTMNFDKPIKLSESICSDAGNLPDEKNLTAAAARANLVIGQGELMLTPLHISCLYSAIANGGSYNTPSLIKGIVSIGKYYGGDSPETVRVFEPEIAEKLKTYLTKTVAEGTGALAQPAKVTAAGKTATAQTGWTNESGEVNQAWFAGFFPAEEPRYTVVILKEYASSGSHDCAPIFKKIADGIIAAGR